MKVNCRWAHIPAQSTNTDPSKYEYTLEAEGTEKEIELLKNIINRAIEAITGKAEEL